MVMLLNNDLLPRYNHTPLAYVSIVAANTSTTLYQVSPGNKARVKKLIVRNRTGVSGVLRLGYTSAAAAWVQVFPDLDALNGVTELYGEEHLPAYWWRETGYNLADIILRCSQGAADPTDVQVFAEIEEQGLS